MKALIAHSSSCTMSFARVLKPWRRPMSTACQPYSKFRKHLPEAMASGCPLAATVASVGGDHVGEMVLAPPDSSKCMWPGGEDVEERIFRLLSFPWELPRHRPALPDAAHGQHEEDGFEHILLAGPGRGVGRHWGVQNPYMQAFPRDSRRGQALSSPHPAAPSSGCPETAAIGFD